MRLEYPAPATVSRAASRYLSELAHAQAAFRYPRLADDVAGEPLCRLGGYGDGLTTVSARDSQLPWRALRGVLAFRLSQFLQAGLMDPELAYRKRLVCEPVVPHQGPETIHTVTVTGAGQIVGYAALAGSADPVPLPVGSPARARFPAEIAHGVDLLASFAAPGLTTHNAYEVKRFARERSMARGPQRDRVAWHLILALYKTAVSLGEVRLILGDSGERGALRYLRLVGFEPVVVEGTVPRLPHSELMWPSYEVPAGKRAKPFAAAVTSELAEFMAAIEAGLAGAGAQAQARAISRLIELHRSRGSREGAWAA